MNLDSYNWHLPAGSPAWLGAAILADRDPLTGSYSAVYPSGDSEVVKLVSEPGALAYLQLCQATPDLHLPVVHEILATPVVEMVTGIECRVVRMERLRDRGTRMKPYSNAFVKFVRERQECTDSNVALSYLAVTDLAEYLRPFIPTLASTLKTLAVEMVANDWVSDLANPDNWMTRADGTIVLSDPVHHVDRFADDLI